MKAAILIFAWGLGLTTAQAIEANEAVGTWRLVTATRKIVDTGEVINAYGGSKPNGWINYGSDGRMMVICAYEGRDRPASNDKMSDEDRVKLHKTFFSYAGTYKFEGNKVTHNIDTSWNESWSGTSQVRIVEKKGNQLIYTTVPFAFSGDGKVSVVTLVWEKYPQY